MLNFAVDPKLLAPLVPAGTELDFDRGQTFVSVVGFMFLDTRVVGLPIPLHRDFEEVNLRFYVRRLTADGWRRGVTFVRELVPRRAIVFIARRLYGEPYSAVPMRHSISEQDGKLSVKYQWRLGDSWESLAMSARGAPKESTPESHEEFITEHYWGYTARRSRTSEYRVDHPRWRLWLAETWNFNADVGSLYGPQFVDPLTAQPISAFIAEGSRIEVQRGSAL